MDKFTEEYARLNKEQKEAVDTIEGPVMVIAGPGTGKTQTLALRIANILKITQVNPSNILCLTFTDNGAVEMLSRLTSFIGTDAYKVKISTFHSFCEFVMQSNLEKFPQLVDNSQSIDETDKIKIILEILSKLSVNDPLRNIKNEGLYAKDIIQSISKLKKEGISVEDLRIIIDKEKTYFEKTSEYYEEFLKLRSNTIKTEDVEKLRINLLDKADKNNIYTKGVIEILEEYTIEDRNQIKAGIKKIYTRLSSANYFEKLESLLGIFEKYQNALLEKNQYDYEDMIMFVLEKLTQDEELLVSLQEQFQYILVDEYQDTNSAQNELIYLLSSYFESPNLFVVGDDDQSIFKFQGASLENILQFTKRFSNAKIVTLRNNYRSQPNVLKASRDIITQSENRLEDEFEGVNKDLVPMSKLQENKIELKIYPSFEVEAEYIAQSIKELLKENNPSDIAVIMSTNRQMDLYAETLTRHKIPHSVSKTGNLLNSEHINNFLLILEYVDNPMDDQILARILYMPYWGFDNLDLYKLFRHCSQNKKDYVKCILSEYELTESGVQDHQKFIEFGNLLSDFQNKYQNLHPAQLIPILLEETGVLKYLLDKTENYQELVKFNNLYTFLKNHIKLDKNFNIKNYLENIQIARDYNIELMSEKNLIDDSRVSVLTVYKAKGLEFKHVFIPTLTEGEWEKKRGAEKIKLPRSINKEDYSTNDLDEKIRVFFVAITRAKENIYLSYPNYSESGKENRPSMFTSSINEELIEKVEVKIDEELHKKLILSNLTTSEKPFTSTGADYLKVFLDNFVLSPTSFNSYRKCPHCFFINTILRLPEAMSTNLAYGNAIHNTLKNYLSKYKRTKNIPTLEFLRDDFKASLHKQFLTEGDIEDLFTLGIKNLEEFYENELIKIKETSLPEMNFRTYKIRVGDVPVKGMIDRIDFVDELGGVVDVIDYKTGRAGTDNVSVKNRGDYYVQLLFYKLLIQNFPKYNWKVNSGKIVYVDLDNTNKSQDEKVFDLPDEDIEWLKLEIKNVYDSIMNLEFSRKNTKNCYNQELHNINFVF
ncbi:MAG TPA: ATP-dependent DNA helicase [Candidatus Dojkabacteria bacterium]|nr:ATP-dependent DNA helicase [Candidatus Dojkabacteria bacterium]HRP51756.1 ATP-dependent DNA helicase [Candidatus Dojkabacteria bacterium]